MNNLWYGSLVTLAQAAEAPANKPAGGFDSFGMMLPWIGVLALFYFLIIAPQRREQSRRDQMLRGLKKNDRVVTSSGILGSVANISADGKEVTLKLDDNVRVRFRRASIFEVLSDDAPKDEPAKTT